MNLLRPRGIAHLLLFPCLLGVLLMSGCIAQVPYTPNGALLDELGPEQAEVEFRDLLTTRTQSPQVYEVELNPGGFVYRYAGGVYVGWAPVADGSVRVLFSTVNRVDIYENRKLFMVDAGGQRLGHEMVFASLEDCFRFADLLVSYRTGPTRRRDRGAAEQRQDEGGGEMMPRGGTGAPMPRGQRR